MRWRMMCAAGVLLATTLVSGSVLAAGSHSAVSIQAAAAAFGLRRRLDLVWERVELVLPLSETTKARLHLEIATGELQHAAELVVHGHRAEASAIALRAAADLALAQRYGEIVTVQGALLEHLVTALPEQARMRVERSIGVRLGALWERQRNAQAPVHHRQGSAADDHVAITL